MKLRTILFSAACVAVLAAPTSAISLLSAAAAAKGLVFGAGLTASLSGGSNTVVIQSQHGSSAQLVPANEVVLDSHGHNIHTAQTITYSTSPLSRIFNGISDIISAKAKAISNIFGPNHVVVVVPKETTTSTSTTTTTTTTTPKPTTTPPHISIEFEHQHSPGQSVIELEVEHHHKPLVLPSIEIHKPSIRGYPVVYNYLKK